MKKEIDKSKVLEELINYIDQHNLDIQFYNGIAEPGYSDTLAVAANWNEPNNDPNSYEGYELLWSDEWIGCNDCGKAVRTIADSYFWEPYYSIIQDCEIVCHNCLTVEDMIEEHQNKENKAIPSKWINRIKMAGFYCFEDDEETCAIFENGFFPGQNDRPEKILEKIREKIGDFDSRFDFIFAIVENSQFYIRFALFIRPKDYEEE
jgi:hypothetical protein